MRKFECQKCNFIYDEALGLPDQGIAPGTLWEDLPEDTFFCPVCRSDKSMFELVEE